MAEGHLEFTSFSGTQRTGHNYLGSGDNGPNGPKWSARPRTGALAKRNSLLFFSKALPRWQYWIQTGFHLEASFGVRSSIINGKRSLRRSRCGQRVPCIITET